MKKKSISERNITEEECSSVIAVLMGVDTVQNYKKYLTLAMEWKDKM